MVGLFHYMVIAHFLQNLSPCPSSVMSQAITGGSDFAVAHEHIKTQAVDLQDEAVPKLNNEDGGLDETIGMLALDIPPYPKTVTIDGIDLPANEMEFLARGGPDDFDGDGIPNAKDNCLHSNNFLTVFVGDCDSQVKNTVGSDGCTIGDKVDACAKNASNHGQFVSCVSQLTNDLNKNGTVSDNGKEKIQSCASSVKGCVPGHVCIP